VSKAEPARLASATMEIHPVSVSCHMASFFATMTSGDRPNKRLFIIGYGNATEHMVGNRASFPQWMNGSSHKFTLFHRKNFFDLALFLLEASTCQFAMWRCHFFSQ
jgi:hypothetical protein